MPLPEDSDRSLPDTASVEAPTATEIDPDELELPVTKEMSPDLDTSAEPVDNDKEPLPETPEALVIDTTPLASEALEPLAKYAGPPTPPAEAPPVKLRSPPSEEPLMALPPDMSM